MDQAGARDAATRERAAAVSSRKGRCLCTGKLSSLHIVQLYAVHVSLKCRSASTLVSPQTVCAAGPLAMAPKAKKQEEARLRIEEELTATAKLEDEDLRRGLIERRLIASATADDKAITLKRLRLAAEKAAAEEKERKRVAALHLIRRRNIEARMVHEAQEEDAAENRRRAALRAAQAEADVSGLAAVLADADNTGARRALTEDWGSVAELYSHWGAPSLSPGQLLCGVRMIKSRQGGRLHSRPEAEMRAILSGTTARHTGKARAVAATSGACATALHSQHGTMSRHLLTGDGLPPDETELRLVSEMLQKGGYSDLSLAGDAATLHNIKKAAAHRPAPPAPHLLVKQAYTPPRRPQPPPIGQELPVWRAAPHIPAQPDAEAAVRGGLGDSAARGTRRVTKVYRNQALRAGRLDPRYSYWPPQPPTQPTTTAWGEAPTAALTVKSAPMTVKAAPLAARWHVTVGTGGGGPIAAGGGGGGGGVSGGEAAVGRRGRSLLSNDLQVAEPAEGEA